MTLAIVYWRDANFSLTDEFADESDYIMTTVGWVSRTDDGRWVRVVGEKGPEESAAEVERQVTRIPRENIVDIEPLGVRIERDGVPDWFVQEY